MQASIDAVRSAVDGAVGDFDAKVMRPLQKQTFLCSAKCVDTGGNEQVFQHCLQACTVKVGAAEQAMNQELGQLQERLQRCMAHCQDKAADVMRDDASQQARAQGVLETCVAECARHSAADVPKLSARMLKAHKP